MAKVFIGGSRSIAALDGPAAAVLGEIIAAGDSIVIGDASGADKAVQEFLAERGYPLVSIYCVNQPRINLAGWPASVTIRSRAKRDFALYAIKDRAMAGDADRGFMIWDGASQGTLNNVRNLLALGKPSTVYLRPRSQMISIASDTDLNGLLARCDPARIAAAMRRIETAGAAIARIP